jgi:V8-like Glu-specific endopeptidase
MRTALAILLLVLVSSPSPAQLLEAHVDGRIETLSIVAGDADFAATGPVWWRASLTRFGESFVRLHFSVESSDGQPPSIVGVEGDRGGRFSYAVSDIGPEGVWTGLLPSGTILVSLLGLERPAGLKLAVDRILIESETGTLFSTWGGVDETLHINDPAVPEAIRALAAPVARLSFVRGGLPRSCTGFLVSDDAILTNEHCVADAESCRSMVAIFGYEYDGNNRLSFGRQFRCRAAEVIRSSFDLDAALVTLDGPAGVTFGKVALADADAAPAAPLVLIQHPGGDPKQVSFINCAVLASPVDGRRTASDVAHSCDTAGGSSGAPVFDADGRVVALHHYGFAEGQVETWTDNRAVLASGIQAWLREPDSPEPAHGPP